MSPESAARPRGLAVRPLTRHVRATLPPPVPAGLVPAANDQPFGDGLHAAMQRAIAAHGIAAGQAMVTAAQRAFWAGDISGCRWWRSVGRLVDRRLAASLPARHGRLMLRATAANDPSPAPHPSLTRA